MTSHCNLYMMRMCKTINTNNLKSVFDLQHNKKNKEIGKYSFEIRHCRSQELFVWKKIQSPHPSILNWTVQHIGGRHLRLLVPQETSIKNGNDWVFQPKEVWLETGKGMMVNTAFRTRYDESTTTLVGNLPPPFAWRNNPVSSFSSTSNIYLWFWCVMYIFL